MTVQLSVIIPTLNRLETAKMLSGRIRDLLPGMELEVIVVSPLASAQPPSAAIRWVADAGRGVYAAYNAGLLAASGEYIWFIGDDDYPLDASTALSSLLEDEVVDLLVAPVLFSSGRIYRPARTLLFLHFFNWCQQGVIYRRRELVRRRFFRRMPVQADQYVNVRMRADPAMKIRFMTLPLCMFGVNGISGSVPDHGYRGLRFALAHRTLGCATYIAFRLLMLVEPLAKRLIKIR